MLKKISAILLLGFFAMALLSSCGNHCDCPSFKEKKHHYKRH